MPTRLFPSLERGHAKHGWLETYHSFSFADFYDPNLMGFGALRVVNDDTIAPGAGFPEHPHSNMEIITIPLSGAVKHRDSSGGEGVVKAGEVQVMSAGTGVVHSEYNASRIEPLTLFQIWIEPDTHHIIPRYADKAFDEADRNNKFQLLVSPDSRHDSLMIHQLAYISLGAFASGQKFHYPLYQKGNGVFLMVVEGGVTIEDEKLNQRDAIGIKEKGEVTGTTDTNSVLLVIEVPMG